MFHALTTVTVVGLRHFTVQSSFKLNIPSSLIVPSCHLKLGAALGQGVALARKIVSIFPIEITSTFIGEFGVVYKGYVKTGMSDTITGTVAVKTLKG